KHRDDRADAEAEQEQSEDAVVDGKPRLRERHQRRPARDAEARNQKGEPGRKACRRPIVAEHENSGGAGEKSGRHAPGLLRHYVRAAPAQFRPASESSRRTRSPLGSLSSSRKGSSIAAFRLSEIPGPSPETPS